MVRSFPSDSRRRLIAVLAALVVALCVASPLAFAKDDLKDKQREVKKKISHAHDDLEHSSARLRKAANRLSKAKASLQEAREHLSATRGELTAARVRDQKMQVRLDAAVLALEKARADLKAGRKEVADQKVAVGDMVADIYDFGDPQLKSVSSFLNAEDPGDMTRVLSATDALVDGESAKLNSYKAAEVLLELRADDVKEKKEAVKEQREAAAANLKLRKKLEKQARAERASVRTLVGKRASARKQASKAKAHDARILKELKKEQDKIEAMLRARAARQARKHGGSARPQSSGGFLSYPVNGSVSSPFGYRTHPIYGYYSLHDGTDFAAGCGAPLYASANGKVISRYYQSAWGNRLIIDHGYQRGVGLATIYNHATHYVVGVGERVKRGQVVGYVGTTGWSTGCHLHFTVMVNGSPKNPMNWF